MTKDIGRRVEKVRRFNRFYTRRIGVLNEKLLRSPFSLTEVRVLYELAHRDKPTATELGNELRLDPGYLSRLLGGLEKRRLVAKTPADTDARQSLLALTKRGLQAFATLSARSNDEIHSIVGKLSTLNQKRLVEAMQTIEGLLDAESPSTERTPYILRPHEPGDMGWVVQRHGVLYAQEYGWDERFEALVASIVARFIEHYDPRRERCWMAEKDGETVGSVFLVTRSKTVAQLRLLLVEPSARGLGIGRRLVAECARFARQAGYKKVTLWTNSVLHAARHLYEGAGFRLVREERHKSFGHDLIAETWELKL
jgi:DNA-binding MarR family transcriptional regulator/GNAT superfamily N-acetyltransferase